MGLTKTDSVPDYFGGVHLEVTSKQPDRPRVEELKKPFKSELVSLNINFLNAKTKKIEWEFQRYIRPTQFPQLNKQTTIDTGITQEKLNEQNAQPLDEVLRELDRFLKEKSLVSMHRNKKRSGMQISSQEL